MFNDKLSLAKYRLQVNVIARARTFVRICAGSCVQPETTKGLAPENAGVSGKGENRFFRFSLVSAVWNQRQSAQEQLFAGQGYR
jgi:hypothetical protein